jgi:SPX domain protein involved in polyphosphate accumulation/uncharacterized membrane protein YidH (DUF202 family)
LLQFGKYLQDNQRPQWRPYYIDYKALKDLISASEKESSKEAVNASSLRTTSLSVVRQAGRHDTAEERFFRRLEAEVSKIGAFTAELVAQLRTRLNKLQDAVAKKESALVGTSPGNGGGFVGRSFAGSFRASSSTPAVPDPERDEKLLKEAKDIGDEFLALEKYVNLNYMGFHKILKKHDKRLPHTPCRQFYVAHLHNQPWVQGNYSDLMVILSNVFSQLRGDKLAEAQGGSAQAFKRSTTKYWVRTQDVSAVKRIIIENMPVFVFNQENYNGDAQLVNSVYFDNESLELYHGRLDKKPGALALRVRWYGPNEPKLCFVERKTHREGWKGEKSVKERFTIPEEKVVPYIEGEYTSEQFINDLLSRGKSEEDARKAAVLFEEIQRSIESKQLKPFIRTQYMRSAFQMGHDRTVSFTLDTNLVMLKENPEGHPTCSLAGRWYRDPKLPIHRTEITRFPHAVLEIKLALPDGESAPEWVQGLMSSGLLTEVHKSSKFIHGTAVLFPELVQAVPYWIDDESVRDSIAASAPAAATTIEPTARDANVDEMQERKPRRRGVTVNDGTHPLLGNAPTLALMRGEGGGGGDDDQDGGLDLNGQETPWWNPFARPSGPATSIPQRLEPKTFLASERTFMSWLHMAITLASIAAALLAFASTSHKSKSHMHSFSKNLVEFIALVLLPLAMFIVAYATMVFLWRNSQIALKQASYIDDRRGPLLLAVLVVSALSAIFIVSAADLIEQISGGNGGGGGDAPPPSPSAEPPSPDPYDPPQLKMMMRAVSHLVLGRVNN